MSVLIISMYTLIGISVLIFFGSASILWLFPKSKVLSVKELEKTYRHTIPPKIALNTFGKRAYSGFYVAGVLLVISLSILVLLEFTYGGTCLSEEIDIKSCIVERFFSG